MIRRISFLVVLAAAGILIAPVAAAGGGCQPDPALEMQTARTNTPEIDECAFEPAVIYVDPGDRVTWMNKDMYPHTVTGALGSWGSEEILDRGDKVSYAFKQEGVFPFYCALHPGMVGAVVVGDGAVAAGGFVPPAANPEAETPVPRTALVAIASLLLAGLTGAIFLRRRAATPATPVA